MSFLLFVLHFNFLTMFRYFSTTKKVEKTILNGILSPCLMTWRNIHRTARLRTKTKPSTKSVSRVLAIHIISCEASSGFDIMATMTSWGWNCGFSPLYVICLVLWVALTLPFRNIVLKAFNLGFARTSSVYILCVFISVLAQSLPTLSRMTVNPGSGAMQRIPRVHRINSTQ